MIIKRLIQRLKGVKLNAMSFRETMDLTGLPLVTLYQGDRKFNFLLDTGSTDSVIDSNILPKLTHEKTDYEGTLTGLDGIVNKVSACNITFSYKDKNFPFSFLSRDMSVAFSMMKKEYGVTLHGILGANFFNKYKYVLDFADLIAYSKQ